MLAALGYRPAAVPPVGASGEVLGELRPALLRRFGLTDRCRSSWAAPIPRPARWAPA